MKTADKRPDPSVAEAGSDRKRTMHPAPAAVAAAPSRSADRSPPHLAASLLRTRPVAAGEHFHVHCKPLPAGSGVLLMAVPKRLLARAVDRNLVRRLAREAWRGAGLHRQPLAAMVKLARRPACLARSRVTAAAARRGAASTRAAGKATLAGAGSATAAAAPDGAVTVRLAGQTGSASPSAGRRSNKKQLRAELDQLLATVCRRLGGSRP